MYSSSKIYQGYCKFRANYIGEHWAKYVRIWVFSDRDFQYKDRIFDIFLIRGNTGQKKPCIVAYFTQLRQIIT